MLLRVASVPAGAERLPRKNGKIILAEGEATGHAHAVASRDAAAFEIGGRRYLVLKDAATVVHEEHAPIDLERGYWRVIRQREYVPSPPWRRTARPLSGRTTRPVRD